MNNKKSIKQYKPWLSSSPELRAQVIEFLQFYEVGQQEIKKITSAKKDGGLKLLANPEFQKNFKNWKDWRALMVFANHYK